MNRPSPLVACAPLVVATFAVGTDAWVVAGFLSPMAHDLNVSRAAAGSSVIVFAVAYAVAAPLLAACTATRPRRQVLVAALVALGAANLITAAAPDLAILLGSRVIAGAAASLVTPTAGVIAAASVPNSHRARALAVVIAGLTLATAIGVPFGAQLSTVVSWRGCLLGVAALCGFCAVTILLLVREVPPPAPTRLRARFAPIADPQNRRVLLLTLIGMAAAYCPYAFIGEVTHTSGSELTLVLTAYGIGAVIGSLASGRFTDNAGPTRTLTITYLAMPIALLITATGGPPLVTFLAVAGWGATSWAQTPPQQHRLLSHNANNATMVIGLNASALYLGVAVGTSLGSLLLTTGTHVIVSAATALAICAAVLNSRPTIAHEKQCAETTK